MMEEYRKYREASVKMYQEQRSLRLDLRGGAFNGDYGCVPEFPRQPLFLYFTSRGEKREVQTWFLSRPCHFHKLNLTELSSDLKDMH